MHSKLMVMFQHVVGVYINVSKFEFFQQLIHPYCAQANSFMIGVYCYWCALALNQKPQQLIIIPNKIIGWV
jgi:hypothetical protein